MIDKEQNGKICDVRILTLLDNSNVLIKRSRVINHIEIWSCDDNGLINQIPEFAISNDEHWTMSSQRFFNSVNKSLKCGCVCRELKEVD